MNKFTIVDEIDKRRDRSQWDRGVTAQALDMLEDVESEDLPTTHAELEALLLNGADGWEDYSASGCALVCNYDIAARYMTPSELKRYNADGHDSSMAFHGEELLDMQARACRQAYMRIRKTINKLEREAR